MGQTLTETCTHDPKFHGGTFCCHCATHLGLVDANGQPAFSWEPDGERVGPVEHYPKTERGPEASGRRDLI